jgi:hypothetical protein
MSGRVSLFIRVTQDRFPPPDCFLHYAALPVSLSKQKSPLLLKERAAVRKATKQLNDREMQFYFTICQRTSGRSRRKFAGSFTGRTFRWHLHSGHRTGCARAVNAPVSGVDTITFAYQA